ncbi:MAG TPA: cell division protein ZapB [Thermoanaerobaculia bacterium]|nr:cell division protein ZapB [Thermoanaerobaculia bacterium]
MKKNQQNDQLVLDGTEESEMLTRLTERVERAIQLIGQLRRERDDLQARVTGFESSMKDSEQAASRLGDLETENEQFKTERSEIRSRIEKVLTTLEQLETAEAE